jgi:hypothetical protein
MGGGVIGVRGEGCGWGVFPLQWYNQILTKFSANFNKKTAKKIKKVAEKTI